MTVPYTDDELADAQVEARRLLRSLITTGELNLTELCENGWCRDASRVGLGVIDSRAWALMTALLELAFQAIDEAERSTSKMYFDILGAAERWRGLSGAHTPERYREKVAKALGA